MTLHLDDTRKQYEAWLDEAVDWDMRGEPIPRRFTYRSTPAELAMHQIPFAAGYAAAIKDIEAAVFKPEFDAHSYEQERLVMEFCMEIAGKRGELGCSPDPVRLLEMADALYQAEFNARTQPAPTGAKEE